MATTHHRWDYYPSKQQIKNNDNNNNSNTNQTATEKTRVLDDFYKRPHITSQQVPFLVVGGSDGSGTRMFVQTLVDLGVTMIVDNFDTMDVHGEEMAFVNEKFPHGNKLHGWPPLVQMILKETHSVNYTIQNLSKTTQQQAIEGLLQLKSSLVQKGRQEAKRNRKTTPGHHPRSAAHVQFGWKAPISLVLLPVLQQVLGPIKFIHVVRDGRDVAVSDNQSPVQKFYTYFYNAKRPPGQKIKTKQGIAAMQLWNDWNTQVWKWARKRQQALDDNDLQTFDYLVMRTEDLIDPSTRLEALVQLAEFVGARVTPDSLCCLSQKDIQDMGQSELRQGGSRDLFEMLRGQVGGVIGRQDQEVIGRYGKWRQKFQGQSTLLTELQDTGAEALGLFGYEPSKRFLDRAEDLQSYACKEDETAACSWMWGG